MTSSPHQQPTAELKRDKALAVLLEIRGVLGGTLKVDLPDRWRNQVCGNVIFGLTCHSDPAVREHAKRIQRSFGFLSRRPGRRVWFSVPVPIDSDGPGDAA